MLRPFTPNMLHLSGTNIVINPKDDPASRVFLLTFKYLFDYKTCILRVFTSSCRQLRVSEEDKERNCVNYPTATFKSFAECDIDFVKRTLPEGANPYWVASNVSLATTKYDMSNISNPMKAFVDMGMKIWL